MNVVYNSDEFYVVEYPADEGYEIVSKTLARSMYLHHAAGDAFVCAFRDAAGRDSSAEAMDDYLNEFCPMMHNPVVFH